MAMAPGCPSGLSSRVATLQSVNEQHLVVRMLVLHQIDEGCLRHLRKRRRVDEAMWRTFLRCRNFFCAWRFFWRQASDLCSLLLEGRLCEGLLTAAVLSSASSDSDADARLPVGTEFGSAVCLLAQMHAAVDRDSGSPHDLAKGAILAALT